ncbi:GSCOCG00002981001-RA-CDS [Cotesia congregata]|uniref:Similar to SDR-1: Farnesol dehydrogenase (Aedes aegypti) n=1 Tax=Cotesia congregata TaxID=51543 RepID=A0A8J2HGD0_COTCN|nr:GSCOCG00002981001-RA-CDS [Cotesia congregata]CAG5093821.1 Similar to SDR-1: Farnesol dehydrogenase (Aedes aegypti) [Cotesia congregata]
MDRWVGKIAIVSGVSSGIGELLARELVSAGVNVLGLARRENKLQELSKSLKNTKGAFHYLKCDVRNERDIVDAFAYVEKNFGQLDILINNAAVLIDNSFENGKTEDYRSLLETNVLAPALFIREALKLIRKHKNDAYIVNINSICGLNATVVDLPMGLYPASKFAMTAMNETLKKEIKDNNDKIRVTAIHPGVTGTELFFSSELHRNIYNNTPYLKPKNVVDCIMFALSAPSHVQIDELIVTAVATKK